MKNYFAKTLLLTVGVVLAVVAFPTRNQLRQLPPKASTQAELRKILPKHSALPPVARFDESSLPQDPQDQERRVHRERLKGLNTYDSIRDPGVREINGQAEGIALT